MAIPEKKFLLQRKDEFRTLDEAIAAAADHKAKSASIADADPVQSAQFISDMLLELRNISYHAKLTQLTYFLEMAFYEAFEQTSSRRPQSASPKR